MGNGKMINQVAESDIDLLDMIQTGSRISFEKLITKYQPWIYNIVIRMVLLPEDAEDITQEILIKIITNLSSFNKQSSFKTWLFKIVKNHVLNMKKCKSELHYYSFSTYGKSIDESTDFDPPDTMSMPVEMTTLMNEIQIHCMTAMLLCLKREQRLVFILGEIIGIDHNVGSKIFEISKTAYRKRLSRSRNIVYQFMQERCGLVKSVNSCHCEYKLSELIESSIVNPLKIKYNPDSENNAYFQAKHKKLISILDQKCRRIFRRNPKIQSPDFIHDMKDFIYGSELTKLFQTDFSDLN